MIEIVAASSAEYLPWCATMLRSCIELHPGRVRATVLHDDCIPPADQERLRGLVLEAGGEIAIPRVEPSLLHALPRNPRFGGRTAALPLLLPHLRPDLDRVLYIDVDTLVVASLDDLWAIDLEGAPLAAVRNVVEPDLRERVRGIGLDPLDYLNSGVLLYDLARIRQEGSFDEVIRVASGSRLMWFDQDALNIVFAGRWKHLHPRYNAMNSLWTWEEWAIETFGDELVKQARTDPAILHFEGPALCKPWHYLNTHPWRDGYRSTLRRTPWRATPLEDRLWSTRAIRLLPAGWRIPAYWKLERLRRRRA